MPFNSKMTEYGLISENFSRLRLGEVCIKDGVQTGPFGSQLHQEDYVEIGTPIITVEHLGDNRILHQNLPKVSDKDHQRLSKYQLKTGDIVFSRVGSVDRRALVKTQENGWLFSGRCLRVRVNPELIDSTWLSYFFGLPAFKEYIRGIAVGATMPSLNTKILSEVPIYFPKYSEQREIADILAAIDENISINLQANATLERIAQSLFKSWLIDFDPVKAKMAGRQPDAMTEATAALFPAEFEESEIGLIPKGWRIGTLGEIALNHRDNAKVGLIDNETPYIGLEHMPRQSISLSEWGISEGLGSGKFRFSQGDILFGKLRPYFHKVGVAAIAGVCSTDILVIHPIEKHWFGLALSHLSSAILIDYADKLSNGAKMPRTNWNDLSKYKILIPSQEIAEEFSNQIGSIIDLIRTNIHSSKSLAGIRDTLLPKLMSGQLRIPDSQPIMDEVAA